MILTTPKLRNRVMYLLSSVLGILLYIYLFYSESGTFPFTQSQIPYLLLSLVTSNVSAGVIQKLDRGLNNLISWKNNIGARLLIDIIIKYAAVCLIIGVIYIAALTLQGKPITGIYAESSDIILKLAILLLAVMITYSIINFTFFSYNEYSMGQIEKVKQERKQLALQYNALRNQLSPHYLFNSLNTISSLIYEDETLTENFIRRLADTYQYILNTENKMLVPLRNEMGFVHSYQYLLSVRYKNSIKLETSIDEPLYNYLLPPLSLQMLVENGVKHNIFDSDTPLDIRITSRGNNTITVTNNRILTPTRVNSLNLGLDNIRKRYKYFTARKVSIIDNKDRFSVTIPLIPSDQYIMTGYE